MAIGLGRAIELAAVEVVPAHHGENPPRPIVERQQGTLGQRLLVELGLDDWFLKRVLVSVDRVERRDPDLDQVARSHELVCRCASNASKALRPARRECTKTFGDDGRGVGPKSHRHRLAVNACDDRRDDVPGTHREDPTAVLERGQDLFRGRSPGLGLGVVENVPVRRAKAASFVVRAQPISDGFVCRLLETGIERRMDAEALLIQLRDAVFLLQVLTDFFDESTVQSNC